MDFSPADFYNLIKTDSPPPSVDNKPPTAGLVESNVFKEPKEFSMDIKGTLNRAFSGIIMLGELPATVPISAQDLIKIWVTQTRA
jgi:hypothetical protein